MATEYHSFATIIMYLQYIKNAALSMEPVKPGGYIFDSIVGAIYHLEQLNKKELNDNKQLLIEWRDYLNMNYKGTQQLNKQDSETLNNASRKIRDEILGYLKNYSPEIKKVMTDEISAEDMYRTLETIKDQFSEYLKNTELGQLDLKNKLDTINKIISAGQSTSLKFLVTSMDIKEIKSKLISIIRGTEKTDNLLICSPYLGTPLSEVILDAIKRGVNIRIICRPLDRPNRETKMAYEEMSKKLRDKLRTKNEEHARFYLLEDKEGIVTSADIDSASLDTNFNAGIWTNNPVILLEMKEFFEKIWTESGPVKQQ